MSHVCEGAATTNLLAVLEALRLATLTTHDRRQLQRLAVTSAINLPCAVPSSGVHKETALLAFAQGVKGKIEDACGQHFPSAGLALAAVRKRLPKPLLRRLKTTVVARNGVVHPVDVQEVLLDQLEEALNAETDSGVFSGGDATTGEEGSEVLPLKHPEAENALPSDDAVDDPSRTTFGETERLSACEAGLHELRCLLVAINNKVNEGSLQKTLDAQPKNFEEADDAEVEETVQKTREIAVGPKTRLDNAPPSEAGDGERSNSLEHPSFGSARCDQEDSDSNIEEVDLLSRDAGTHTTVRQSNAEMAVQTDAEHTTLVEVVVHGDTDATAALAPADLAAGGVAESGGELRKVPSVKKKKRKKAKEKYDDDDCLESAVQSPNQSADGSGSVAEEACCEDEAVLRLLSVAPHEDLSYVREFRREMVKGGFPDDVIQKLLLQQCNG